MSFVVLDASADPKTKLVAHDDLEAHMIATGKWGQVDFAFAYIGDLHLPNYDKEVAGPNADDAVVLVVVEKVPDDAPDDLPLNVLGFIFVVGEGQVYDTDGVWKDAVYFGELADEIEEEGEEEDDAP